jgi:hypothetical protein
MNWQTEYPTLATVNEAAFSTLQAWDEQLPAPQDDVQRTLRRRIKKQMMTRAGEEVREKAPEVAEKWNSLMDRIKNVMGGGDLPRM